MKKIEGMSAHPWRTWWLDKSLTTSFLAANKPWDLTARCDANKLKPTPIPLLAMAIYFGITISFYPSRMFPNEKTRTIDRIPSKIGFDDGD